MFHYEDVCIEIGKDWSENKWKDCIGNNMTVQVTISRKTSESIQRLGKGYYCSLMKKLVLYIAGQQNSCQIEVPVLEWHRRAEYGCPCSTITPQLVS